MGRRADRGPRLTPPASGPAEPGRLDEAFFDRPVLSVARDLLGCRISHAGVTIRLTEVEAYDGEVDPGSHAFRGRTPRTAVMFGPPGGLYVYFTYGMHYCANLVCGPDGVAAAVLLRAGEVIEGSELARVRRGAAGRVQLPPPAAPRPLSWPANRGAGSASRRIVADRDLARGPARLTQALALTGVHNGIRTPAPDSPVVLRRCEPPTAAREIRTGPRVGVAGPGGDHSEYPWRFWLAGESTVSPYRPGRPPRPRDGRA